MSIENLNEPLNTIAETNDPTLTSLVFNLLDRDMDLIQKLGDEPNIDNNLTADELKAKFDEAGNVIKKYINETLIPAISDTVAEAEVRAAAEAARVENEKARVSKESERIASEDIRIANELNRVSSEAERKAAEENRISAEIAREDKETGYVEQAKSWAEKAEGAVNEAVSGLTQELAVERSRIDNLATLKEGSTTGDAELIDGRVGADGVTYTNLGSAVRGQVEDLRVGFYSSFPGKDLSEYITTPGSFRADTGAFNNSADAVKYYVRSELIPLAKGEVVRYRTLYQPTNFAVIAWYDKNKKFLGGVKGWGASTPAFGTLTMPVDGYIRLGQSVGGKPYGRVEIISHKKELSILVLGNSFSQDSFAYLPPVLNEILPDYAITYGVAYRSGAGMNDHIRLYNKEIGTSNVTPPDGKYTFFNYWNTIANKWMRYYEGGSSLTPGQTLEGIMGFKAWDIIYVQGNGSTTDPESNIIAPGRQLLRILQGLNRKPFSFITGQWLATNDYGDNGEGVFANMVTAMQTVKKNLGIRDYIPIGTAIQNARTNSNLQSLGDAGNMLYDTHMQSGIPALIATYTIALKILDCIGEAHRGIYGSTFEPTRENCIAINAYKEEGMTTPMPMTHGEPQGVTTDNIRAAQEIAVLAVNNPTVITDCSGIVV